MTTRRRFAGKRLSLTLAFGVLVAAAIGAACNGFFPPNTLETIAIQPPSLDLGVTATQQFTAWGTYQDGTRSQITSGLVWTSSDTVDAPITTAGIVTGVNVTSTAATITGAAQGLDGTATVSVIGDVTTMSVSPTIATVTVNATGVPFTFTGTPGPPTYITADNGGALTITATGTGGNPDFLCTVGTDAKGNPAEVCSATTGAGVGSPYTITMSYPTPSGGTATASATANISGT
jgi:hypothetical protein